MEFYIFTIKYIFLNLSTTKKENLTKLELEKHLAWYPFTKFVFITCIESYLNPDI